MLFTQFFFLLSSESNCVYMEGVKLFVCWRDTKLNQHNTVKNTKEIIFKVGSQTWQESMLNSWEKVGKLNIWILTPKLCIIQGSIQQLNTNRRQQNDLWPHTCCICLFLTLQCVKKKKQHYHVAVVLDILLHYWLLYATLCLLLSWKRFEPLSTSPSDLHQSQ